LLVILVSHERYFAYRLAFGGPALYAMSQTESVGAPIAI
jgi:hypothetical protein